MKSPGTNSWVIGPNRLVCRALVRVLLVNERFTLFYYSSPDD
jgi:hypothetical protein